MKIILGASTNINVPASFHPVFLIQLLVLQLLLGVSSAFTLNNKSIDVGRNGHALVFRSRQRSPSVSVSVDDGNTSGPPIDPDLFDESMPICNQVVLVGRIGVVPEPRYLPDGKVVLNVGLAVKRQYNSYERIALGINYGEEETDWFTLQLWGKDAEFMAQYVTKGARVGVSGSLFIESWADKETKEERTAPKVRVEEFHLLESRAEAELRSGGDMDIKGARKSNTNRTPWNISTGYKTRNENLYQDDNEDNDPFSTVGSGLFFK